MDVCKKCGALTECCAAAKVRREINDSLSALVDRQSRAIAKLTRERDEARQVVADLRAKVPA